MNLLREDCCPLPVWLKMSRNGSTTIICTFQSVMNKVKLLNIFDNLAKLVCTFEKSYVQFDVTLSKMHAHCLFEK